MTFYLMSVSLGSYFKYSSWMGEKMVLYLFILPVSLKNVSLFQLSLKNCSKDSSKELSPLTRDRFFSFF